MKNMKGKFLRKLKTISTPNWNPSLVFQANSPVQTSNPDKEHKNQCLPSLTGDSLSVSETSMDVKEEAKASGVNSDCEEKLLPSIRSKEGSSVQVTMHDRVQLSVNINTSLEIVSSAMEDQRNCERAEEKEKLSLLSGFEDRVPPGGKDSVVLYTTSLRGIRKTFEDCNTIRFLLESFRVVYSERDVSMHMEYREELWRILGGRVVPPRLFIRGRYIGGADEVVGLHEKGMLQNLLQGIPLSPSRNPCRGCAGMRFVLCCSCNGSRKVVPEGRNDGSSMRCPDCNENGLIKCSICS